MSRNLKAVVIAGLALVPFVSLGMATAAEIRIGIVAATTGPAAFAGKPISNGAILALEEVNQSGMFGADKLVYELQDTGTSKAQALTLVSRYARGTDAVMI